MVEKKIGGNRKKKTMRYCIVCGKYFYPVGGRLKQKTCSRECGYKIRSTGHKKGKKYPNSRRAAIRRCLICNEEFRAVNDYDTENGRVHQKYCSKKCWAKRAEKHIFTCNNCGNEFEVKGNEERKYCSRECGFKHMVGPNAPAYKDGKSLERERARFSNELSKWRKQVYKRDSYTCQECGKSSQKGNRLIIHAHHIKLWSEYPDERFNIDNGITLCVHCHGAIHGRDFTKRLTRKICRQEVPVG